MTIENIISRASLRENKIWSPFAHCFIGAMDIECRAILFGLYANGFKHGFMYLVEISSEQLLQITDRYESSMAQLGADEQAIVIKLAAKRYLESLDQQIHDEKIAVQYSKIDAENLEYDAKEDALRVDRAAIETTQKKVAQAILKADADISILEARIEEEVISQNYVEIDILEKELAVKNAQLQTLQAGVTGLKLQLRIIEAGITGQEIQLREKTASVESLSLQLQGRESIVDGVLLVAQKQESELVGKSVQVQQQESAVVGNQVLLAMEGAAVKGRGLDIDVQEGVLDARELSLKGNEVELAGEDIQVRVQEAILKGADLDLQKMESEVRGSSLQVDVGNTNIQNLEIATEGHHTSQQTNLIPGKILEAEATIISAEAEIIRISTNESLLDADIAEIENREARVRIDIESKNIDTLLLDVDIAKAQLDTAMVDVDIQELSVKTVREAAKRAELTVDTAMIDARIVELQLDADKVKAQLVEIEADIAVLDVKMLRGNLLKVDQQITDVKLGNMIYEIPAKKQAQLDLISKQIEIIDKKMLAAEEYQLIEDDIHTSRLTKQGAEQTYKLTIASLDTELALHRAGVRIHAYSKDVEIAGDQEVYQQKEDTEHIKIPESQVNAADTRRNAAIDAVETMATANIINTLTHEIGAA